MIEPPSEKPLQSNEPIQPNKVMGEGRESMFSNPFVGLKRVKEHFLGADVAQPQKSPVEESASSEEDSPQDQLRTKLLEKFHEFRQDLPELFLNIDQVFIEFHTKELTKDYTGFPYETPTFKQFQAVLIAELFFEQKQKIVFMDVDMRNLKGINDIYGQERGDLAISAYFNELIKRVEAKLKSQGKTFYCLPYRLRAGGDEFRMMFSGNVTIEEVSDLIRDLDYTNYSKKGDKQVTTQLGAEHVCVEFTPDEPLAVQILALEEELEISPENRMDINGVSSNTDKAQYMLELFVKKAEREIDQRKNYQLIEELRKIEDDCMAILSAGAESIEEIREDIEKREEKIREILTSLGTRRAQEPGMAAVLMLQEILAVAIFLIKRHEELPDELKAKLRLISENKINQLHIDKADAHAASLLGLKQGSFEFPES